MAQSCRAYFKIDSAGRHTEVNMDEYYSLLVNEPYVSLYRVVNNRQIVDQVTEETEYEDFPHRKP